MCLSVFGWIMIPIEHVVPSPRTDGGEEEDGQPDKEALRKAFLAGFTTARTGRCYGELSGISERAANTKFEQYYRHRS